MNAVVDQVLQRMKTDRITSIPYVAKSNGAIEKAVGKSLHKLFALFAEQSDAHVVSQSLHESGMKVLGDRTPNEVMFGRPPMRPIEAEP